MTKDVIHFFTLISILLIFSCRNEIKDSYKILDSNFPNLEAKIFAKGIISKTNRYEQFCSFSPDGLEFYYSYTDREWKTSTILKVNILNPSKHDTVAITNSNYQCGQFIDKSGKKMFFSSLLQSGAVWHADIYLAKRRKKNSSWGEPEQLLDPVNSIMCEWHPTFTIKGELYFASERGSDHSNADIYRGISSEDDYLVDKLDTTINTKFNEMDPLISPDGSYLIFASNRPWGISEKDMFLRDNGSQELDLYISFNKGNNTWSSPKNMGKEINTTSWEFAPALSPDMKYLFFTRRTNFKTYEPSKIYWISADIINQLKK